MKPAKPSALTDADIGVLLKLLRDEIYSEQHHNWEHHMGDSHERAWRRKLSHLRTIERKLRRQRKALRDSRAPVPF